MQNLNTLFNLVKQAAPVARGSQQHQDLVGKLNNGEITQDQFNNAMQGFTPVTGGSQQHQDLVGKLNNNEITQGQFNGAMQGMPIPPVDRGSQDHQDLVGRLNDGEISQDQFSIAMRGGRRLKERNFFSDSPALKQKTNGTIPAWYLPITINPYSSSSSPYTLPEDLERRMRSSWTLAGGPGLYVSPKIDSAMYEKGGPGFFGSGKMHPGLIIGIGNYGQQPWEGTSGGGLFGGDKTNPFGIDMDLHRYYDEFWKWYNKDRFWSSYRPGSAPLWEDGVWKKHKDEFMKWKENNPTPVTPGSQEHQKLVDQLNKGEITKDQFNDAMNGRPWKPVTPGSQRHLDLVDQLNKGGITKELFTELMNGKPQATPQTIPVTPGSQQHLDLVGQLNNGQISQGQFNNAMSGAAPVTLGSQQHQDLVGQLNRGQITQGQFDNHFQGAPVARGSQQHQDLVGKLNRGQMTQGLFDNAMNGVSALSKPQPTPLPAPAPQPSTPSVGSAIGKSTYNPASITRKDMNKYRKYTSARNMNSDMDRWKTWQAMNGNRNASNADYRAAKRNNFM